nr:uncharacterized protein DKFZp434B061-like [Aegilops tauschii subsp. strangulata]
MAPLPRWSCSRRAQAPSPASTHLGLNESSARLQRRAATPPCPSHRAPRRACACAPDVLLGLAGSAPLQMLRPHARLRLHPWTGCLRHCPPAREGPCRAAARPKPRRAARSDSRCAARTPLGAFSRAPGCSRLPRPLERFRPRRLHSSAPPSFRPPPRAGPAPTPSRLAGLAHPAPPRHSVPQWLPAPTAACPPAPAPTAAGPTGSPSIRGRLVA